MYEKYSVLMPLWYKENLEYLTTSIESMLGQTAPPSELVLAADHSLTLDMEALLVRLQRDHSRIPIRVEENATLFGKGLGAVLAFGVSKCRYPLIARMDTDDISFPDRCEKELEVFRRKPELAVVGGGLKKFSAHPDKTEGYRIPPECGKKLKYYSKFRNPFNHPTVMFRREVVIKAGNYSAVRECEDYELWYRILKAGYEGYNLQVPVLYYRAGKEMLKRRKNPGFYRQSQELVRRMYQEGYSSFFEMAAALGMHAVRYYAPFSVNELVYKYVR